MASVVGVGQFRNSFVCLNRSENMECSSRCCIEIIWRCGLSRCNHGDCVWNSFDWAWPRRLFRDRNFQPYGVDSRGIRCGPHWTRRDGARCRKAEARHAHCCSPGGSGIHRMRSGKLFKLVADRTCMPGHPAAVISQSAMAVVAALTALWWYLTR